MTVESTRSTQAPIVDFDLYDPGNVRSFHDCTLHLPPISYTHRNGGHWIVNRHDLITRVLSDDKSFSSYPAPLPGDVFGERRKMIPLELDGAEHRAHRRLISSFFSPRSISSLAEDVREVTKELINGFAADGECEFMSQFARPLPALVFLKMMGMPLEGWPEFCGWVDSLLYGKGEPGRTEAEVRDRAKGEMYAYFERFIAEQRKRPRGGVKDITDQLLNGELKDGRPLSDEAVLDYFFLLLIAGLHTVEGVLAFGAMYFSDHPDERSRLIARPELMDTAIEELLRWNPVAWGTSKRAIVEVEVGGVIIQPNEVVMLPHQGANMDPAKYENPHQFDPTRKQNPHMSFGWGVHMCVGAHLARRELKVAFEELHATIPDYRTDGERPPVFHVAQVVGVESLHLKFTPAERVRGA